MANNYEGFLYAAANDVQAIEALARISVGTHSEVIAFHAQQAAEKIVKNVFALNDENPPKTHAVDELLAYAVEKGWLSNEALAAHGSAAALSQFAVLARYTQARDVQEGEALQAIVDYRSLCAALESEGCEVVPLDVPAEYLRGE